MKKVNSVFKKQGRLDLFFLVLVLLLLVIGLFTLYSAGYAKSLQKTGSSYTYIRNQGLVALFGVIAMVVISFVPYKLYKNKFIVSIAYLISVALLFLVLAVNEGSQRRWLYIGSFQFQPSELAKLGVVLAMAYYYSRLLETRNNQLIPNYRSTAEFFRDSFKTVFLPALIFGVCAFLVAIETHLSGAVLIAVIGASIMLWAGVKIWWFLIIAGIGGVGLTAVLLSNQYMQTRVQYWLHPELDPAGDGYQALQSLYAIGSGGLSGLGYGNSNQKYLYLPEPQNDFVFSIFSEEWGWIGALILLALFAVFVWRGFYIAFHLKDRFSSLTVVGIMSRIAVQMVFNICVVTGLLPVTGISLPFFSYGGTALLILLVEMGIVLQMSREIPRKQDVKKETSSEYEDLR